MSSEFPALTASALFETSGEVAILPIEFCRECGPCSPSLAPYATMLFSSEGECYLTPVANFPLLETLLCITCCESYSPCLVLAHDISPGQNAMIDTAMAAALPKGTIFAIDLC
jgi:hypothetical protein